MSTADTAVFAIVFFVSFIMVILFCLPFIILNLAGIWKTLKKAGEKGWKCLIPFYGDYTIYKIAGRSYWSYLIASLIYLLTCIIGQTLSMSNETLVRLVGMFVVLVAFTAVIIMLVLNVLMAVNLSKRFGYSGGYAAIYFFIPIVFWCILGFSRNQYIGNAGPQPAYAGGQPQYNPNSVDAGQNNQYSDYQNPNPMG